MLYGRLSLTTNDGILEPRSSAEMSSPSSLPSPPGEGEWSSNSLRRRVTESVQGFDARVTFRKILRLQAFFADFRHASTTSWVLSAHRGQSSLSLPERI